MFSAIGSPIAEIFFYSFFLKTLPIFLQSLLVHGNHISFSWSDGEEQDLDLKTLREACPCALCQGERDVIGTLHKVNNEGEIASCELKSYQIIGGYGLQFVWNDRHATGIYSFDYLRGLSSDIK